MALITRTREEDLRYFSSIGYVEGVRELISQDVDLNSGNSVNGWTALHWAAARGHPKILEILLQNGANPEIRNKKGEIPANLTRNNVILKMLGEKSDVESQIPQLSIIPSYLKHPTIPVCNSSRKCDDNHGVNQEISTDKTKIATKELTLKVRIAHTKDPDFIEIDLDQRELTMEKLTDVCCSELGISKEEIIKIRKLPDTVIRKDRDVQRLKDYQEIEIVLYSKY